jgi:hypothetical protein
MIVGLHSRQIERQVIQYTFLDDVTDMQKMNHSLLVVSLIGPLRRGRLFPSSALKVCPCSPWIALGIYWNHKYSRYGDAAKLTRRFIGEKIDIRNFFLLI